MDERGADAELVRVLEVLREARRLGFLGPGPVEDAVAHARGFLPPLVGAGRILDLGSGGGIPALVIAAARPDVEMVLLDARERRTDWLVLAVTRLGWTDRVRVVTGRAEELARQSGWRASQDAVVARSFGSPLVTAECAVPFLRVGGVMVVSEPPRPDQDRWPPAAVAELGLEPLASDPSFAVFRLVVPCPPTIPRTVVVRRR